MVGRWIYRLARSIYSLKNSQFSSCDLVVPLGYGLLNRNTLPDAAQKTLKEAVRIATEHQVPLAWASANYFWLGCEEQEGRLKMAEANAVGLSTLPIVAEGVTNSVTEARSIRRAISKTGLKFQCNVIVIVADWPHARSARKIWREVFPESVIAVVSIDAQWNESHPAIFARSEWRWLFINVVRHIALIILGAERVSRLPHHPIKEISKRGV